MNQRHMKFCPKHLPTLGYQVDKGTAPWPLRSSGAPIALCLFGILFINGVFVWECVPENHSINSNFKGLEAESALRPVTSCLAKGPRVKICIVHIYFVCLNKLRYS